LWSALVEVNVPVPAYLNVTLVFLLAVLITCVAKVTLERLVAASRSREPPPAAGSWDRCLSWTISVAFFAPVVSGSNLTPKTQLVVIVPVQVLLAMVKSVVSPSIVADVAAYVVPPFTVTVLVALVVMYWLPKASDVGLSACAFAGLEPQISTVSILRSELVCSTVL
jgi:hypothetical protein